VVRRELGVDRSALAEASLDRGFADAEELAAAARPAYLYARFGTASAR
jgi:hypothetical protein